MTSTHTAAQADTPTVAGAADPSQLFDVVVIGAGQAGLSMAWFLGLPRLRSRGSALLGFVQHDAAHLDNQMSHTYQILHNQGVQQ